jgi:hypothetical protein
MKYDIYNVESPFQLLGALEAKKQMTDKDHAAVLIVKFSNGRRRANDEQIRALIEPKHWQYIHIQTKKSNKYIDTFFNLFTLLRLRQRYKNKVRKYFYGEIRDLEMNVLGRMLEPDDMVLLDDGAFTIVAQLEFIKKNKLPYNKNVGEASLYNRMFNLDLNRLKVPNLFSNFYLDQHLVEGQFNYYRPKPKRDVIIQSNDIYYFGSKFSEAGILSLQDELKLIESICLRYVDKQIFYIPHRDESLQKLEKIKALGANIKALGKPAEIFFDETLSMPFLVASCYSTVLYSCYSRFNNVQLQAYDILHYIGNPLIRQNVENVYNYYESVGIKRIVIE